jgi:hypothetical protein
MKVRTALIAVAVALTTLTTLAETADAIQLGPTQNVCASTPTPSGWVDIAYSQSFSCGPMTPFKNFKVIENVTGTTPGGVISACVGPRPSGFFPTRYSYTASCDQTAQSTSLLNSVNNLINLNGLSSGSQATICDLFPPPGWTLISRSRSSFCVTQRFGSPTQDNQVTIRKS